MFYFLSVWEFVLLSIFIGIVCGKPWDLAPPPHPLIHTQHIHAHPIKIRPRDIDIYCWKKHVNSLFEFSIYIYTCKLYKHMNIVYEKAKTNCVEQQVRFVTFVSDTVDSFKIIYYLIISFFYFSTVIIKVYNFRLNHF